MATIKSFTDKEQSKKLAKILPNNTSDFFRYKDNLAPGGALAVFNGAVLPKTMKDLPKHSIPVWSLVALLDIIPHPTLEFDSKKGWRCIAYNNYGHGKISGEYFEDSIDSCVDLIETLYKNNLI
jgi:hypothetical protein